MKKIAALVLAVFAMSCNQKKEIEVVSEEVDVKKGTTRCGFGSRIFLMDKRKR